ATPCPPPSLCSFPTRRSSALRAGDDLRVRQLLDAGCRPFLARLPGYEVLLRVRVTSDGHGVRVVGDDVVEFLRIVDDDNAKEFRSEENTAELQARFDLVARHE